MPWASSPARSSTSARASANPEPCRRLFHPSHRASNLSRFRAVVGLRSIRSDKSRLLIPCIWRTRTASFHEDAIAPGEIQITSRPEQIHVEGIGKGIRRGTGREPEREPERGPIGGCCSEPGLKIASAAHGCHQHLNTNRSSCLRQCRFMAMPGL